MSMSTNIVGFKPPDKKWKEMKAVYDACISAKIPMPTSVIDYFDDRPPDSNGVEVSLKECTSGYTADMQDGIEVDLTKLPKDVTRIRFYNSY